MRRGPAPRPAAALARELAGYDPTDAREKCAERATFLHALVTPIEELAL